MKRELFTKSGFFNLRALIGLLLCAATACFILIPIQSGLAFLNPQAPATASQRTLRFEERVFYQRAIEEVYGRHRIWPKERPDPKPSLDAVISQAQIEGKVEDYLRNSQALEDYWQKPITAEQLQAEMERMAQHTKQPEVLRELFAALNDDPFVIAECLARPTLAERLVTNLYAHDERFHGELRQRAEADLLAHHSVREMKQSSGHYNEVELLRAASNRAGRVSTASGSDRVHANTLKLTGDEWEENIDKLASMFDKLQLVGGQQLEADQTARQAEAYRTMPVQKFSDLQEDDGSFYAAAVIEKGKDRLKVASLQWPKESFDSWRVKAENQIAVTATALPDEYRLPPISGSDVPQAACVNDTWTATTTPNAPAARTFHTAVWTGAEMIVWAGRNILGYLNDGGKYNPSTNSWTPTTTTNAPAARIYPSSLWTGTEMIVWGGFFHERADFTETSVNDGGKCNPARNSWSAPTTTTAPSGRDGQTAVWTGRETT